MSNQITTGRARHLVKMHTPKGWKVKMGGSYNRGASGLCAYNLKTIFCPLVIDDYSLVVFLHEVGHVKLHKPDSDKESHVEEYEAEQFAFAALRGAGFHVTREILRSAKDNVRTHILAENADGVVIDKKIARWCGHSR